MAIELSANPRQRSGVHTLSPAGYQAYLKARYHWNNRGAEGLDDALAYFSQVVAREPAFADGHAAMARAHVASAEAYRQPPRHELELAHEAAARALALDPELSEAHLAIGETYRLLNWDWASAEDAYARAILLNPSNENARRAYSVLLVTMERRGEAVREAERACELDPMCLIASLNAAWVHYAVGDYDRAIERCRHALDMEARRIAAHRLLAAAYLQDGGWDRAIAALEAGLSIDANDPVTLASLAHARAIGGDTAAAEMIGARLSALDRYVPPLSLALVSTGLADLDAAFDALDTACVARDPMVAHVVIDPRFEPLRRDPRYSRLRTTLKLSSYP
jgi:Tfp pilus assembly protein PilF